MDFVLREAEEIYDNNERKIKSEEDNALNLFMSVFVSTKAPDIYQ